MIAKIEDKKRVTQFTFEVEKELFGKFSNGDEVYAVVPYGNFDSPYFKVEKITIRHISVFADLEVVYCYSSDLNYGDESHCRVDMAFASEEEAKVKAEGLNSRVKVE
ncbi:MAG: hypothetical protein LBQ52_04920 [Helicobacteraceae bacterium]|jgi:hypothetical protein|nr:hypothetical protein [Helicobacteraceae bacterium]